MITWEECELLISGTHKDFDNIMDGKGNLSDSRISRLRQGDLILRNIDSSKFYHAGVYCGNEEIIEFTATQSKGLSGFVSCSSSSVDGGVTKVAVNNFINGLPYRVLRLKISIPSDFAERVKKAMKSKEKYNVLMNNCLHFALRLLGVSI